MSIIGIISHTAPIEGNPNAMVAMDYVKSVRKGGGIPLIIPVINDKAYMEKIIHQIDGLLIPGGEDVHPNLYHQELTSYSVNIDEALDQFELDMIQLARLNKKPILAICRGHQILNIAFGGTLYQDLSLYKGFDPTIIHAQHLQKISKEIPVHEIQCIQGTQLWKLFGSHVLVNSFHHQAIDQLGEHLRVSAYSKDHLIEAVESTVDAFVLGVQWHPEKTVDYYDQQMVIFKKFVLSCEGGRDEL